MKTWKTFCCMIVCILFSVTIAGCGQEDEEHSAQPEQQIQAKQSALWKTQGFAVPEDAEKDGELNIREYILWEHKRVFDAGAGEERHLVDSGSCGQLIWQLSRITEQAKHREWVLELYDAFTEESIVKKFSYEELGLEDNGGTLRGMDLIDRDHYVFQWVEAEYDDEGFVVRRTADKMIYTDLADDVYSVDLWPSYLEAGLVDESAGSIRLLEGNCDGRGNTYVMANLGEKGYGSIHFFDRSGNLILEYKGNQFQTVQTPLRTQEGELVFPVWDNQNRRIEYLWADLEGGKVRSLASENISSMNIYQVYGMQENDIYYNKANKEIVRWNIESGERTKILDLPKNGLGVGLEIIMALGGEEDQPVLCLIDRRHGKDWLTPLTVQEVPGREPVRVADLVKRLNQTENPMADSVSLAANINRDFFYLYEEDSSEEDRTRILADLSSGNGPDLMYVSLEDMRMLEEKGALLDMRELLSETCVGEMLPGVSEIGSIDGKLVGIPVGVTVETLMVSRDTWSKDTWSLEDVIRLMESGELEGAIYYNQSYFYPLATMKILIQYSLGDSFLIDWENRKSHFEDERFLRLLELTYTYLNEGVVETDTRLNGGKRISLEYAGYVMSANTFDVDRERENGYYVGYPTNGDCGNYLTTEGVIVVNAATKNKEAVRAYLEILCSNEFQLSLSTAGAFGINSEKGFWDESTEKWIWTNQEEVAVFQDNTTSIDRVNSFLQQCVAAPPRYTALEEIIAEELNVMYEQNRAPEDVAKIINNRVQLYLDEGK